MKKVNVLTALALLLLFSVSSSYAKALLKIMCDINGGKIYIDGKFKAECYKDDPVEVIVPAGKHVVEVKKPIDENTYYYFKKELTVRNGKRVTIMVNSRKKLTEEYYYKKAQKSQALRDYGEYLERFPKGKYANQVREKLKKVGYPMIVWQKTFGGGWWDEAYSVIETKDGNYLIVGRTGSFGAGGPDAWIIKIDKDGNKIWSKTFGGRNWDGANSVIETKDGNYLVVGWTESFGAGGYDIWIIKIDRRGRKIWDKTFGGKEEDGANSVIETKDGNYLVVGWTESFGAGDEDAWVIKIDKDGNRIWSKTFGGRNWDGANSVIETKDGNYLIVGRTESFGAGGPDAWIIKIDKDGNKIWSKTFGGRNWDIANSVIETKDGNYLIVGWTESFGAGKDDDVWVIKIDKNGNKIWDKTFGGRKWDEANSVIETKDGNYLVVGGTKSFGAGWNDAWVIKIDKNGNRIWDKTFGGKEEDEAYSVIETKDGNYLVVGRTKSFGAGEYDAWVVKLKPLK